MMTDPEQLPDEIASRRFHFSSDTSYKFWTIALDGRTITTSHGRIGNQGTQREVQFDSRLAAKREYARRVRSKLASGYKERLPPKKKELSADQLWEDLAEHEPFLQAILDDPDDVTGFAIYADWLCERGDPLGEFTRLQLQLESPELPFYQRTKIDKSIADLRLKHTRKWLGSLAPWLMDAGLHSYMYSFQRGQLAEIHCPTLSAVFASELRRSPYCRFLRELSIQSHEQLSAAVYVDGKRLKGGREYGLETLRGADFTSLRVFRAGVLGNGSLATWTKLDHLWEMIESMPRLESLYLGFPVDLLTLSKIAMPNLRSLHLFLRPADVETFEQSRLLDRIDVLELLQTPTNPIMRKLLEIPSFHQLTYFLCRGLSQLTPKSRASLEASAVNVEVTGA